MSSTRQLAAILFTDIAGYTAIMQADEQLAVKLVKHHRLVLEKTVSAYDGEVIEYFGDGSLCILQVLPRLCIVLSVYNCSSSLNQQFPCA
jgi:class 3 adenylate cyclase